MWWRGEQPAVYHDEQPVIVHSGALSLDHGSDDGDHRRDQYAGAPRGFRCFHVRAVDVSE